MLTLSRAIRIGSLIRPQCYGNTQGKAGGGIRNLFKIVDATCAWGAAQEAIGADLITFIAEEDLIPFRGLTITKKGSTVSAYRVPND